MNHLYQPEAWVLVQGAAMFHNMASETTRHRRDRVVYADVIYTFISKKSFKYLKNFNETAADSLFYIFSNTDCTFFFLFKYIILYLFKPLLFH